MTDETRYTPGPWRVEEGTTLIWGDCRQDDETNYGLGYPVAECRLTPSASWAKGPRTYEEAEANAQLVAAAPEMLQALRKLVLQDYNITTGRPFEMSSLTEAILVIAKAEGRSK